MSTIAQAFGSQSRLYQRILIALGTLLLIHPVTTPVLTQVLQKKRHSTVLSLKKSLPTTSAPFNPNPRLQRHS